jgi:hypothetical protein
VFKCGQQLSNRCIDHQSLPLRNIARVYVNKITPAPAAD